MFISIIFLIIGFIVLIKGADYFVDGASSVATNLKVSKMVIALTIVAFGTSAPEFAVSIKSMLSGNGDIVLGNVIGSNIINILLILGVSALVKPLSVKSNTVRKELPLLLMITTLLAIVFSDNAFNNATVNMITRSDGLIILLFFLIFIYYLFSITRNKKDYEESKPQYKLGKSIIVSILGIISIIIGSEIVVRSATEIAQFLGVSERIIGLTIIALGTSLPELVTSVIATKKNEVDLAVGNIIGSNIFNIGIVLALPVVMFGDVVSIGFQPLDIIAVILSAVILFFFAANDGKISRREGFIMLLVFAIYYGHMIIGGVI